MARRLPQTHEETRAYMHRLMQIIAADRRPAEVLSAAEEADRALSGALWDIQRGAPYGYMAGDRLEDYRRVQALRVALASARALELSDLAYRAAAAVAAAGRIAEPWRGWWE